MDDSLKVAENKVPGCLSTVHVHASLQPDGTIIYQGDADSMLTKGLVSMLVNGLTGHTSEEIQSVQPEFIQYAGVAKSLTPGRNNGFLNMLNLMKIKANQLSPVNSSLISANSKLSATSEITPESEQKSTDTTATSVTDSSTTKSDESSSSSSSVITGNGSGPVYESIIKKLSMLQPKYLNVEDDSHKHAGHAGIAGMTASAGGGGGNGETHFNVAIVADCFNGLSRVQRHQMVYTLLAQELKEGVHALSISAKTPDE